MSGKGLWHRSLGVGATGLRFTSHDYGAAAIPYIAAASLAATAAGTTASIVASQQQASYQAAVARNNQNVASVNATTALQQGQEQEQAKQEQTAQLIGKERAAAGASNIDVNSGSALKIQSDSAQLGELDALTIRNNAARQAWNYTNQSNAFGAEASQAGTAANLNSFASLIGGASSVSSKWASWQNAGVFDG